MARDVVVVNTVAATAGGNQDITTTGLSGTPNACLVFASNPTSDGSSTSDWAFSIGAAVGTGDDENVAFSSFSLDANTSQQVLRGTHTGASSVHEVVSILSDHLGAIDGQARVTSFLSNGVRINWGNTPETAFKIMVVLFVANQADVFSFSPVNDTGNEQTVANALTAQADVAILMSTESTAGQSGFLVTSVGVSDGTTEACLSTTAADSLTDGHYDQAAYNTSAYVAFTSTDNPRYSIDSVNFATNGDFKYTPTTRQGTIDTSDEIGVLLLRMPNGVKVTAGALPTATGSNGYTGAGFRPEAVLGFAQSQHSWEANYNSGTFSQGDDEGQLAFMASAAGSDTGNFSLFGEDAIAETVTHSRFNTNALDVYDDTTATHVASFTSFDSDGFTLNHTTVLDTTNAWRFVWVAFEESCLTADLIPDGDDTVTNWTLSAGVDAYALIDDDPATPTSDNIVNATAAAATLKVDVTGLPAAAKSSSPVTSVQYDIVLYKRS